MLKWIKRILTSLLGLIVVVVVCAVSYEQIQRVLADRAYPPPGQSINVGGHRLHALIKGNGNTTVVFESGLGIDGHLSWYKVQDAVAEFATTISYDRAGVMWSERGANPKTAKAISDELATLLVNAELEPPYVLVGHSLAGIISRPFIKTRSQDIAGIVFVDVSHPEQFDRFPEELRATPADGPSGAVMQLLRSLGILRYMIASGGTPSSDSDDLFNKVVPTMIHRATGVRDEGQKVTNMAREVAGITDFGDIPLIVISGASPSRNDRMPFSEATKQEMTATWNTLQTELLDLSSNSRRRLAMASDHYVQIDEPEIVIAAIRSLANAD